MSKPSGARISIDGKASGRSTPARIQLKPGSHKIRLEAEGFARQEREITVAAGESFALHVELKKRGMLGRINPF